MSYCHLWLLLINTTTVLQRVHLCMPCVSTREHGEVIVPTHRSSTRTYCAKFQTLSLLTCQYWRSMAPVVQVLVAARARFAMMTDDNLHSHDEGSTDTLACAEQHHLVVLVTIGTAVTHHHQDHTIRTILNP